MICNIGATFGHNIQPRLSSSMCFDPLVIYVMSFQSFPTLYDLLQCFYFILYLCSLVSDLLLHWWTSHAFPILRYTYFMCFQLCPNFSDHFQLRSFQYSSSGTTATSLWLCLISCTVDTSYWPLTLITFSIIFPLHHIASHHIVLCTPFSLHM